MNTKMHPEQARLLWDSVIGFVGFITVMTYVQAILNVFAPAPALWPGFLAAGFTLGMWGLLRAKKKYFRHLNTESSDDS
ncbi:hypothetical protein AALI21_00645 [Corynebacteriaceae bacterium 6-324]